MDETMPNRRLEAEQAANALGIAHAAIQHAAEMAAEKAAEKAADKAADRVAGKVVEALLGKLGVDANNSSDLARFRDDLGFLMRMNRGAREVKGAAIKTCVGALVTGTIALVGYGVKDWFHSFFVTLPK